MRIETISIDGFGVWHDWRIEPAQGLTVIHGDNEAGKTTLLAFVRAMLFGFETNRHPALTGGRRGGWLDVVMADERRFRIERYGDRGGEGRLRIIGEDGRDRGPAFLGRLLHGVESSVYRNVFAFRLDELSEFRGLTEGEVAARIYGAGLGTGARSALAIEAALRSEAGTLFKSGGSNPEINRLLRELDEVERELARTDEPADYAARRARLVDAESERDRLGAALDDLLAERRRLERIVNGWEPWLRLKAAEDALAGTPDPGELPPGALERFTRLDEVARASAERLETVRTRLARIDERLAVLQEPSLIAHRERIDELMADRGEDRARAVALDDTRRELSAAERAVDDALELLGDGWSAERVAAADLSVATRAEITGRFRELLDTTVRDLERAELDQANAARVLAEAEAEADSDVPEGEAQPAPGTEAELEESERRLAELSALIAAQSALSGRLDAPRSRWQLSAAVGIVAATAAGVLLLVADSALAAGLTLAAAVALALVVWWRPTGTGVAPGTHEVDPQIERHAAALGLPTPPSPADLDDLRRSLLRQRVALAHHAQLDEERERAERRIAELRRSAQLATERLAAARATRAEAESTWRGWIAERGLGSLADRETALTVLDAAARARTAIRHRDDLREQMARLDAAHAARLARARDVLRQVGHRPASEEAALLAQVDALAAELAREVEAVDEARRLEPQRSELLDEVQQAAARLARDHTALAQLLADCAAADEAALRARAAAVSERERHREAVATARQALATLSGPGEALERLIAEIAAVDDIEQRRERLDQIRGDVAQLGARRDAITQEIGALQHQLALLESSGVASELRQRRADLVGRIEQLAERWSVLALAAALLERTRQQYEREHRPGVIRTAEAYLGEWTDGRYRQIKAPLGGTIEGLERADGRRVPVAGLSRGTAEQLYLALRLGLIEHFADEAEPLPIVMDEILVNFDEARAAAAARSIEQLARRHQILYFTCRDPAPLNAGLLVRLEPATLGAAVGADRPPALERA